MMFFWTVLVPPPAPRAAPVPVLSLAADVSCLAPPGAAMRPTPPVLLVITAAGAGAAVRGQRLVAEHRAHPVVGVLPGLGHRRRLGVGALGAVGVGGERADQQRGVDAGQGRRRV